MNFTLGAMYWINPKYALDDFREDMRRVCDNRMDMLRVFIQWEYVEVEKNKFDFTVYDTFFRAAAESGVKLMPTLLFYLPFHRLMEQINAGINERRRYPCLDRPETREGLEQFVRETVTRYKDSPSLQIWNLWNEPTDVPCLCPHSLAKYAAWLKKKYPTIEKLKESWSDEYYIFKPVLPHSLKAIDAEWLQTVLLHASRGRATAIHLDWSEFQTENATEHLAYLASLVRRIDPVHETHSNPNMTTFNPLYAGTFPWKLAKAQDSTGGSIHPHDMFPGLERDPRNYPRPMMTVISLVRSWADGKDAWIGEYQAGSTYNKPNAYTPRGADISATLYHALAGGLCGVLFWQWQSWRQSFFEPAEFSLRNPSDGGPTERSQAAAEFGGFIRDNRALISKLKKTQPRAAILHSLDEFIMDLHLQGNDSPGQSNRHFNAAFACHQALMKAGIACDFITESQLAENVLARYRVLFLPHVRTIAAETAKAIAEFVAAGGAVWADGRCGFIDKHMFLRAAIPVHGLDKVFGCREADEVAPFAGDLLVLQDGSTLAPFREIQRLAPADQAEVLAQCNGYPAAVRNHYGKGTAELWGTYLTANPDVNIAAMLAAFAEKHGASPEIRIVSGKEVLPSYCHGDGVALAVFTSLAQKPQTIRVELPVKIGKIVSKADCHLRDGCLEMQLAPYETGAVLINKADV